MVASRFDPTITACWDLVFVKLSEWFPKNCCCTSWVRTREPNQTRAAIFQYLPPRFPRICPTVPYFSGAFPRLDIFFCAKRFRTISAAPNAALCTLGKKHFPDQTVHGHLSTLHANTGRALNTVRANNALTSHHTHTHVYLDMTVLNWAPGLNHYRCHCGWTGAMHQIFQVFQKLIIFFYSMSKTRSYVFPCLQNKMQKYLSDKVSILKNEDFIRQIGIGVLHTCRQKCPF